MSKKNNNLVKVNASIIRKPSPRFVHKMFKRVRKFARKIFKYICKAAKLLTFFSWFCAFIRFFLN